MAKTKKWTIGKVNSHHEVAMMANEFEDRLNHHAGQIGSLQETVARLKSQVNALASDKGTKKKAGFTRTSILGILAFVLLLALLLQPTSATNRTPTYNRVSNPGQLRALLQDWADEFDDDWQLFRPRTTAPTATEGMMYYNDTANSFYFHNGTAWVAFSSSSGDSLDNAYDLGSKIDVDGDALELEVDDGSNNSALYIDHDEATNDNAAVVIENAADAAAAVSIQIDGTAGYDIQGTSDNWEISTAGLITTAGGFTIEAADCLFDDTYDVAWDTSRDTLIFQDNAVLGIGGAHDAAPDVGIKWDGTNMLVEAATDDTGQIRLGSTNSMDLAIYGSTNTNIALFDVSAATVESNGWTWVIQDDDNLNFGDSDEFQIEYDEDGTDNLIIVAANANDAVQIGDGTTGTDLIMQSTGDASAQVQFDASGDTNNGQMLFGADDHGIDVIFYGATASQKAWWDQSADTWYFGADAEGVDVYLYADTTGDYWLWDESDEALEGVGVQLHLDDDSPLYLGSTAGDVKLQFDGTDFLIDASTADEGLKIGDTTTGFDVTYYFETAGTITTDYDGDVMTFSDQMSLVFGSNADASIMYDETTDDNLEIAADSVGMSISTNDFIITTDGAAANQVKADATGTVAGYAIVLETTDGGVQVNADGASNGDIAIDAADDMTLTAAGNLTLAVTGTWSAGGAALTNVMASVEEITAETDTLTASESGKLVVGDYTGTQTITLPDAAAGLVFGFVDSSATAGDDLVIDCQAADTIDGDTAGDAIESVTDALGQSIWLVAIDGTQWITFNRSGTWGQQ